MKKSSKISRKLVATVSSGVLLSLLSNGYNVHAKEETTNHQNKYHEEVAVFIDNISVFTYDGKEIEENSDSIAKENFFIAPIKNDQIIFYGKIIPNSEIEIKLSTDKIHSVVSDENGYFEIKFNKSELVEKETQKLEMNFQNESEKKYTVNLTIDISQLDAMEQLHTGKVEKDLEEKVIYANNNQEVVDSEETSVEEKNVIDTEAGIESEVKEESFELNNESEIFKKQNENSHVLPEQSIGSQSEESDQEDTEDQLVETDKTDETKEKAKNESLSSQKKQDKEQEDIIDSRSKPNQDSSSNDTYIEIQEEFSEKENTEKKSGLGSNGNSAKSQSEVSIQENTPAIQMFSTISTFSVALPTDGVYTVQSGDSLGAIASKFGLSLNQLLEWNPKITNPNLIKVGQKINVTKEAYEQSVKDSSDNNQAGNRPFATNQEFIDYIAQDAIKIANLADEPQLYASVMIAQAVHESAYGKSLLSLPPYYNLFGIKGSYDGASVPMGTWEEYNGKVTNITAAFRDYPSYYESMLDYADLLRNGLTTDRNFYAPTWVENTNSYKDATKYLTGTYATDSQYNVKLNNIIEQYDLTRFDKSEYERILTSNNVHYAAQIIKGNYTIDTRPYGTKDFSYIAHSEKYLGKNIIVTQEIVTERGTFALITVDGKELGWVDTRALEEEIIQSSSDVNYAAKIVKGNNSIDTLPYGINGFETITYSQDYLGENVIVTKEVITQRGTFALVSINGTELGWIAIQALEKEQKYDSILSIITEKYAAQIVDETYTVDTLPFGVSGSESLTNTKEYFGENVIVTQVAVTERGTFAMISQENTEIGWVDTRALEEEVPQDISDVHYAAEVVKGKNTIDTLPYGLKGFETITKSQDYLGEKVIVTQEIRTQRGTFALISQGNTQIGWLDINALEEEIIQDSSDVHYAAEVVEGKNTIDTLPYGLKGFETITKSQDYLGEKVIVTQEIKTQRGTFALISQGNTQIGWLDIRALEEEEVQETNEVDYTAMIVKGKNSIDTLPYGINGFETITYSQTYLGETVRVTEEKVTQRGTFAWIELNGEGIGWIDTSALDKIAENVVLQNNVHYAAKVIRPKYTVDTKPYGTEGFEFISRSDNHIGENVIVTQEIKTQRGTFALISQGNTQIGWLDIRALEEEEV
ncbi:GW dipeptide domain-containing protein, partial [Desemzia incerta]|uniref:GW dipeptide domain-containing protein n=1 Tax=Desemzia incerta TaxID=82801 RepID=UPI003CFF8927